MKTNYSLRFTIKRLFILLLIFQSSNSFATIKIEMADNNVYVSTNEIGIAGYKGCETGKLQSVNAYVYTLYRKQIKSQKNGQTCSPNSKGSWIQVAQKESNQPAVEFSNMPFGEYKATVYTGQSIGCTINGDTKDYPSKSIVYHQEKSSTFNLNNEVAELVGATIISTPINNDAIKVFPNPTNGELNIQIKDSQLKSNANIIFYDLLGREALAMSQTIEDAKYQEWKIDVSNFSEGAYLLRVFDNEGNSYEKKVIVTDNK
ncbi:MAG: T9SS type A sorting domain-containing protein [Saprospiraceae bacterium]